jgi:hypothetical protein
VVEQAANVGADHVAEGSGGDRLAKAAEVV